MMKFTATLDRYSSTVGQSITVCDETGRRAYSLALMNVLHPDRDYSDDEMKEAFVSAAQRVIDAINATSAVVPAEPRATMPPEHNFTECYENPVERAKVRQNVQDGVDARNLIDVGDAGPENTRSISEPEGFALELAGQIGFEHINDNADLYVCTQDALLDFASRVEQAALLCGRLRLSKTVDLSADRAAPAAEGG